MMIDKRLIGAVPAARGPIAANVALQWASLIAKVCLMGVLAAFLTQVLVPGQAAADTATLVVTAVVAAAVRFGCTVGSHAAAHRAAGAVKSTLRPMIYKKLLRLGPSWRERASSSEVLQVSVEGVDQLEHYFGSYLPQLAYAALAPLTLFCVLAPLNLPSALVLLVCVPLIPVSIALVQTWAKRLLSTYWGRYTSLGDTFLENLQGLVTLKVYQADGRKHQQMNEEAESFRRATMRVLVMQLNSISVMDLVAFGGAAAGTAVAVTQFASGASSLFACLLTILLAADFFLPMRLLGSFFHIAMNGMAASERMFRLMDAPEPAPTAEQAARPAGADICVKGLCVTYPDAARPALDSVSLSVPAGSFVAVVGESGSGKSTLASVLSGRLCDFAGSAKLGDAELASMGPEAVAREVVYVGHESHLFAGTVGQNLRMAAPGATDDELWEACERAGIAQWLRGQKGLATVVREGAANLSGGQRQRVALARALLHPGRVAVFDEAASSVDVESEDAIMTAVAALAPEKTVVVVSHRLATVREAQSIVVLDGGRVCEEGDHDTLVAAGGAYARLWNAQQKLEHFECSDKEVDAA
ncbi:ABC transporter ATP-binding protein/permease [Atopobiaceae bacterium 24-176]